jgi:hypothetical protein
MATGIGCNSSVKAFISAKRQALLLANKEVYLGVNDETTKYA